MRVRGWWRREEEVVRQKKFCRRCGVLVGGRKQEGEEGYDDTLKTVVLRGEEPGDCRNCFVIAV